MPPFYSTLGRVSCSTRRQVLRPAVSKHWIMGFFWGTSSLESCHSRFDQKDEKEKEASYQGNEVRSITDCLYFSGSSGIVNSEECARHCKEEDKPCMESLNVRKCVTSISIPSVPCSGTSRLTLTQQAFLEMEKRLHDY